MFTQRLHGTAMQQSTTGRVVDMEHDVYDIPFSYTTDNVFRQDQHGWLTGTQRREWICKVTGVDPEPTLRKSIEKKTTKPTPSPKPTSSTEAFDEVLRMMNNIPPASTAELETLRKGLSKVKTKLATAKEEDLLCVKQTKSAQAVQVNTEARIKIKREDT